MERTEKRFANYSSAGLLCGTDGLPHLISDPGLALRYGHAGETLVLLPFPSGCMHAHTSWALPLTATLHASCVAMKALRDTAQCDFHCSRKHADRVMMSFAQLPTVGFLYIAGWIGSVGRDYLVAAKAEVPPSLLCVPFCLHSTIWSFRGSCMHSSRPCCTARSVGRK
jgi:hypothetical protein